MSSQVPEEFLSLLDPTMTQYSIAAQSGDPTTSSAYFVIRQSDDETGSEILIQQEPGQDPKILKSDSSLYPIDPSLVGSEAAALLNRQLNDGQNFSAEEAESFANVNWPTSNEELNDQILKMAKTLDKSGFSSAKAPGTSHGAFACAWAVNEVLKKVVGQPIGGKLSVDEMLKVLDQKHTPITDLSKVTRGNIILSPTKYKNTGHVGIVGEIVTDIYDTIIYANSTARAKWYHSFNIRRWYGYFNSPKKRLDVLFFQLEIKGFRSEV